jgi:hypothetical protein
LWKRPVALETQLEGAKKIFYYDGKAFQDIKKTAEV